MGGSSCKDVLSSTFNVAWFLKKTTTVPLLQYN